MQLDRTFVLVLLIQSATPLAFSPLKASTSDRHGNRRQFFSRRFLAASPPPPSSSNGKGDGITTMTDNINSLSSFLTAAEEAGVGSSLLARAPLLLAPVAALVAGRQALGRRDELKNDVIRTESELNQLKSSLQTTDSAVSVAFGAAALSTTVSLGVLLGALDLPTTTTTATPQTDLAQTSSASTSVTLAQDNVSPSSSTVVEKKVPRFQAPTYTAPVPKNVDIPVASDPYDSLLSKMMRQAPPPVEEAAPIDIVESEELELADSLDSTKSVETDLAMAELQVAEEGTGNAVEEKEAVETAPKAPATFMETLMAKIEDRNKPSVPPSAEVVTASTVAPTASEVAEVAPPKVEEVKVEGTSDLVVGAEASPETVSAESEILEASESESAEEATLSPELAEEEKEEPNIASLITNFFTSKKEEAKVAEETSVATETALIVDGVEVTVEEATSAEATSAAAQTTTVADPIVEEVKDEATLEAATTVESATAAEAAPTTEKEEESNVLSTFANFFVPKKEEPKVTQGVITAVEAPALDEIDVPQPSLSSENSAATKDLAVEVQPTAEPVSTELMSAPSVVDEMKEGTKVTEATAETAVAEAVGDIKAELDDENGFPFVEFDELESQQAQEKSELGNEVEPPFGVAEVESELTGEEEESPYVVPESEESFVDENEVISSSSAETAVVPSSPQFSFLRVPPGLSKVSEKAGPLIDSVPPGLSKASQTTIGAAVGVAGLGVFAALVAAADKKNDRADSDVKIKVGRLPRIDAKVGPKTGQSSYLDSLASQKSAASRVPRVSTKATTPAVKSTAGSTVTTKVGQSSYLDSLASQTVRKVNSAPTSYVSQESSIKSKDPSTTKYPGSASYLTALSTGEIPPLNTEIKRVPVVGDVENETLRNRVHGPGIPANGEKNSAQAPMLSLQPTLATPPQPKASTEPPKQVGTGSYLDQLSQRVTGDVKKETLWNGVHGSGITANGEKNGARATPPPPQPTLATPPPPQAKESPEAPKKVGTGSYLDQISQRVALSDKPPSINGSPPRALGGASYLDSLGRAPKPRNGVTATTNGATLSSNNPNGERQMLPSIDELEQQRQNFLKHGSR